MWVYMAGEEEEDIEIKLDEKFFGLVQRSGSLCGPLLPRWHSG